MVVFQPRPVCLNVVKWPSSSTPVVLMKLFPSPQVPGARPPLCVVALATALPFRPGAIRFVLCSEVLEHLEEDGRVVLDFNQAYNPPCAFNPYTTCPIPLPENRLPVKILAGERAYPVKVALPAKRD